MPRDKIILVGNPNVGKSALFYRLTGQYAAVSNYPGTTIEIFRAAMKTGGKRFEIIDTPGVNSLWHQSEDERVTSAILWEYPDALVVQVCDAKNLARSLALTFQIAEMKRPFVLALNLYDEATAAGIRIDLARFRELVGAAAAPTVAITGEGVGALKEAIREACESDKFGGPRTIAYPHGIERARKELARFGLSPGWDLLTLGADPAKSPDLFADGELGRTVAALRKRFVRTPETVMLETYHEAAAGLTAECVLSVKRGGSKIAEKIGFLLMRPWPGYLFAAAALYLMYLFVGVFAAGEAVDFMENTIFGEIINPAAAAAFDKAGITGAARDLFIGEYGLVTMALTYSIAIIFPIVGAFFIFFGIMEDSGYLPRLAAMLDKLFKKIGLNGKAVLPLILGFGCGTMATLTARILEKPRERIIASLLLALAIPCSAQLGVILGILSSVGAPVFIIWFLTVAGVFSLVGFAAARWLAGATSAFIIEIPPLRAPLVSNILQKVKQRVIWYLKEAVPLFAAGTLLLFILDKTGAMRFFISASEPLVKGALGLPEKTAEAFLIGFLRRDYGAAGLYDLSRRGLLSDRQTVVSIVTITLFVPCLAQFLMLVKERGKKVAGAIFAFVVFFSFTVGAALNAALKAVNF